MASCTRWTIVRRSNDQLKDYLVDLTSVLPYWGHGQPINERMNMKKFLFSAVALTGLLTASLIAGPAVEMKQVAPPPPSLWGVGFYGAIDAGANLYQNRGDDRTFTDDNPNSPFFGSTLDVNPKNDVGFFGGVKLGYVFGTGIIRPTIEGDFFYNGFRGGADFTLHEVFTPCPDCATILSTHERDVDTWINSGAFLANFILRFNFGRFQPYAGAGVGGYYAESAGTEVDDPLTGRVVINTGGGKNHADLAWDVVGGSDYFFNPNFSAFIEYKFLNYTSTQIDTNHDRDLKQHLLGAGVRFFFH
jgi:opacity protein-like surface antigen